MTKPPLNGYKAFYRRQTTEVYAETSFQAQKMAAEKFKARKPWEVTVVLCEKDGETVTHKPQDITP